VSHATLDIPFVSWTKRNTVVYSAVCSLAGLVTGMFGIGGGIVKVRPWLRTQLHLHTCWAGVQGCCVHQGSRNWRNILLA